MSSPCHIELWAELPATKVAKSEKKTERPLSLKRQAKSKVRRFLAIGGDAK